MGQKQFNLVLADLPCGDTALRRNRKVGGLERVASHPVGPNSFQRLFGNLRAVTTPGQASGSRYVQDVGKEKRGSSGFQEDQSRRVNGRVATSVRVSHSRRGAYDRAGTGQRRRAAKTWSAGQSRAARPADPARLQGQKADVRNVGFGSQVRVSLS